MGVNSWILPHALALFILAATAFALYPIPYLAHDPLVLHELGVISFRTGDFSKVSVPPSFLC